MSNQDLAKSWLALWLIPGLSPRAIRHLLDQFGSLEALLQTPGSELRQATGLDLHLCNEIAGAQGRPEFAAEWREVERLGLRLLHWGHRDYPKNLLAVETAPPLLYCRGDLDINQGLHVAFVGSRKASLSGKTMTRRLIQEISQLHPATVIVSGLALGIDAAAHEAALEFGLKTIAVLGNGLSFIYPKTNEDLAVRIVRAGGAVISELPTATGAMAQNFPQRNRIVSGLSRAVVVSEAGERSGASITANLALEQGRELFALPGPADSPFHRGSNRLIQRGSAKLVMEAMDILEELAPAGYLLQPQASRPLTLEDATLTPEEQAILAALEGREATADELAQTLGLPAGQLLSQLMNLEIKGRLAPKAGGRYVRL